MAEEIEMNIKLVAPKSRETFEEEYKKFDCKPNIIDHADFEKVDTGFIDMVEGKRIDDITLSYTIPANSIVKTMDFWNDYIDTIVFSGNSYGKKIYFTGHNNIKLYNNKTKQKEKDIFNYSRDHNLIRTFFDIQ